MKCRMSMFVICSAILFSLTTYERYASAAAVETAGELKTTGGIRFPDNSLQTSACSGCANGVLSIDLGGTGGDTALEARTNLGVPGLQTPNAFTADQTVQGDVSVSGNIKIPESTATTGIIMSGASTLIHIYGLYNFFAGRGAGNLTMTGGSNTAIGTGSLGNNTSGNYNTAVGGSTLYFNTTGYDNTATGVFALVSNTTGYRNAAYGLNSLRHNTTGSYNTAGGYRALYNNTTAGKNTALGANALYTQSYDNTSTPWDSHNTAVGYEALYSNQPAAAYDGVHNTAIGSGSLRANTAGVDNTAVGYLALSDNELGSSNTANGVSALRNNAGESNTASGVFSLSANTSGNGNTAIGRAAGITNTTGGYNTFVGYHADASANNLTNATAIGYYAEVNARVRIGNDTVDWIGGHSPWQNTSDIRAKEDIVEIGYGLEFINSLRPVQFRMKTGDERISFGFIAQDIELLLGTEYSILGIGGDSERTLSLSYTGFIAPMVKAMQEQQEVIESQKETIKSLEERLSRLEALFINR